MTSRIAVHARLSSALARLSDLELAARVDGGQPLARGVGGTTVRIDVEGVPVFVERLTSTDLERRPENRRSTANVFGMPPSCHYGLGSVASPGFGAWRELAAHVTTTGWVLDGRCSNFPVLPRRARGRRRGGRRLGRGTGSPGADRGRRIRLRGTGAVPGVHPREPRRVVGRRPRAARRGGGRRRLRRSGARTADCAAVHGGHGLVHFDVHFRNVLTDGATLFVADFGLAASLDVALDDDERAFVLTHTTFDSANGLALLADSVVAALTDAEDCREQHALIRRWAHGEVPVGIPAAVAAVVERYALLAVLMNDVAARVMRDPTGTSYPVVEVDAALRAATCS